MMLVGDQSLTGYAVSGIEVDTVGFFHRYVNADRLERFPLD